MANADRTGIQPIIFPEGQRALQAVEEEDRVPKEILFNLLTVANRNQSVASQSSFCKKWSAMMEEDEFWRKHFFNTYISGIPEEFQPLDRARQRRKLKAPPMSWRSACLTLFGWKDKTELRRLNPAGLNKFNLIGFQGENKALVEVSKFLKVLDFSKGTVADLFPFPISNHNHFVNGVTAISSDKKSFGYSDFEDDTSASFSTNHTRVIPKSEACVKPKNAHPKQSYIPIDEEGAITIHDERSVNIAHNSSIFTPVVYEVDMENQVLLVGYYPPLVRMHSLRTNEWFQDFQLKENASIFHVSLKFGKLIVGYCDLADFLSVKTMVIIDIDSHTELKEIDHLSSFIIQGSHFIYFTANGSITILDLTTMHERRIFTSKKEGSSPNEKVEKFLLRENKLWALCNDGTLYLHDLITRRNTTLRTTTCFGVCPSSLDFDLFENFGYLRENEKIEFFEIKEDNQIEWGPNITLDQHGKRITFSHHNLTLPSLEEITIIDIRQPNDPLTFNSLKTYHISEYLLFLNFNDGRLAALDQDHNLTVIKENINLKHINSFGNWILFIDENFDLCIYDFDVFKGDVDGTQASFKMNIRHLIQDDLDAIEPGWIPENQTFSDLFDPVEPGNVEAGLNTLLRRPPDLKTQIDSTFIEHRSHIVICLDQTLIHADLAQNVSHIHRMEQRGTLVASQEKILIFEGPNFSPLECNSLELLGSIDLGSPIPQFQKHPTPVDMKDCSFYHRRFLTTMDEKGKIESRDVINRTTPVSATVKFLANRDEWNSKDYVIRECEEKKLLLFCRSVIPVLFDLESGELRELLANQTLFQYRFVEPNLCLFIFESGLVTKLNLETGVNEIIDQPAEQVKMHSASIGKKGVLLTYSIPNTQEEGHWVPQNKAVAKFFNFENQSSFICDRSAEGFILGSCWYLKKSDKLFITFYKEDVDDYVYERSTHTYDLNGNELSNVTDYETSIQTLIASTPQYTLYISSSNSIMLDGNPQSPAQCLLASSTYIETLRLTDQLEFDGKLFFWTESDLPYDSDGGNQPIFDLHVFDPLTRTLGDPENGVYKNDRYCVIVSNGSFLIDLYTFNIKHFISKDDRRKFYYHSPCVHYEGLQQRLIIGMNKTEVTEDYGDDIGYETYHDYTFSIESRDLNNGQSTELISGQGRVDGVHVYNSRLFAWVATKQDYHQGEMKLSVLNLDTGEMENEISIDDHFGRQSQAISNISFVENKLFFISNTSLYICNLDDFTLALITANCDTYHLSGHFLIVTGKGTTDVFHVDSDQGTGIEGALSTASLLDQAEEYDDDD